MLKLGANIYETIVHSAAEGGHSHVVEAIVKEAPHCLKNAVYGAAKGGHYTLFTNTLNRINHNPDIREWNDIAINAAKSGSSDIAEKINQLYS